MTNSKTLVAQKRIWQLCHDAYDIPIYHIGCALQFCGNVDLTLAEKAVNLLVARHDALRMVFHKTRDGLKKSVLPTLTLKFAIIERNENQERIANLLSEIAYTEMQKQFDLINGPLIKNILVNFGNNEYAWIVVMHHIISDGWSMGIYLYEFILIYSALLNNQSLELPPLSTDFTTYIEQKQQFDYKTAYGYWEKRLQGLSFQPKDINKQLDAALIQTQLDAKFIANLKDFSQRNHLTLFTTFFAAYALAIFVLERKHDFIITIPMADRLSFKTHHTMGYFINLVPIRVNVNPNITLLEQLNSIYKLIKADLMHANVPIEYINQEQQYGSPLAASNPIFTKLFSLQNYPLHLEKLSEFNIKHLIDYYDMTEFPYALRLSLYKENVEAEIIYHKNLFQFKEVMEIYDLFINTLHQLIDNPHMNIHEYATKARGET